MTLLEPPDQLDAVHPGHVVVDHKTATVWEMWIGQQFGTAAVGPNIQVLQPQREGQGVSDCRIIVDDKDPVSVIGHGST